MLKETAMPVYWRIPLCRVPLILPGIAFCSISPLFGASLIALIIVIVMPALFRSQIIVEVFDIQLGIDIYKKIAGNEKA